MKTAKEYLDEFLAFWISKPEIKRDGSSLFTPQRRRRMKRNVTAGTEYQVVTHLMRQRFLTENWIWGQVFRQFRKALSPGRDCVFARLTTTVSADLKTRIAPVSSAVIRTVLNAAAWRRWDWPH